MRDAASVSALGRVAFPHTYQGILAPAVIDAVVDQLYTVEAAAASIAAASEQPTSRFLVAEIGNDVIGFLHYDEAGPEPELHRLYLRPGAIGSGVGTVLIETLHESLGADSTYVLLVAADNARAIAFYRRHGLAVRDTIDAMPYYRERTRVTLPADVPRVEAHIMERRATVDGSTFAPGENADVTS